MKITGSRTLDWSILLTAITGGIGIFCGIVKGGVDFTFEGHHAPFPYQELTYLALPFFLTFLMLGVRGTPMLLAFFPSILAQFICCYLPVASVRWTWSKLPEKRRGWWALSALFALVAAVWLIVTLANWYWPEQVQRAP